MFVLPLGLSMDTNGINKMESITNLQVIEIFTVVVVVVWFVDIRMDRSTAMVSFIS